MRPMKRVVLLATLMLPLIAGTADATTWTEYLSGHHHQIHRGLVNPGKPYLGAVTPQWLAARAAYTSTRRRRTDRLYHRWQDVRAQELAALALTYSSSYTPSPPTSGGCNEPPPGLANCAEAIAAINAVFGSYAGQALAVASCESGYRVWATNGQYYGLFQMGSSERGIYGGSSTDPTEQASAAYAYFAASGYDWSPWSCKP